jgi:ssDNA-binding Zn-finger/Zn-ribbon topoisomerase 1
METSAPGNRRLCSISEVACPDSCNQPDSEKGCHFRIGPDRFTCTKCQLRIWRHFMGYELSPTDLQEMLHGEKITSSQKTLIWKKDGNETTIHGRLIFTEEYKVRIAPKLKSKQPTDEPCPKCRTGKLQLITSMDGSKWYGCTGYPQCRFTKAFLPHTFTPAPLTENGERPKDSKRATRSGRTQKGDVLANSDSGFRTPVAAKNLATKEFPDTAAQNEKPSPAISSAEKKAEVSDPDRYQRIPKFILRMLKLEKSSPNPKS